MFSRLYETHVNVADLERSMQFYSETLELELGTLEQTRRIAFYFIGGWNASMLGLWEKPKDKILPQHFAFEVSLDRLEFVAERLRGRGVELTDFFGRIAAVPGVFGWMPAASYYFYDPDGHQLEVLAKLPGSPRPELGITTLTEWYASQT